MAGENTTQLTASQVPSEISPLLDPAVKFIAQKNINEADEAARKADEDGLEEYGTRKVAVILGSCMFCVFFAALDTTIVATLAGPISSSFNSFSLMGWIASSYIIGAATVQPLCGKLTDVFGRRSGILVVELLFALGTLICGLATNTWLLILGRTIAGIGGGGTMSITVFVLNDLVPLRSRGIWQGIGNVVYGVAASVGGLFGGGLNDGLGWRWAFLIQVPFIALSAVLAGTLVRVPGEKNSPATNRLKRIDFPGAFLLSAALILFLLGIDLGGNHLTWSHPLVLAFLPVSLVLILFYIYFEACIAPEPIIPVRLLTHRTVFFCCVATWFGNMAYTSIAYFVPLFFQALGQSATAAGLRLIPMATSISVGSVWVGWTMKKTGLYRPQLIIGCIMFTAGSALFLAVPFDNDSALVFLPMVLSGTGLGIAFPILSTALLASVPDYRINQAPITSANLAFRQTGASIGITVSSAVFQNILSRELWRRLGSSSGDGDSGSNPDGNRDQIARLMARLLENLDAIRQVPLPYRVAVRESYAVGFQAVWWFVLGLSGCMLVVAAVGIQQYRLSEKLGVK